MDPCPHCGLAYDDMRTGHTYSDIYQMFWSGNEDPSTWVNKRRHTVLGRWHQVKLSMWEEHLEICQRQYEYELDNRTANLHSEFDRAPLPYGITARSADDLPVPF